MGRRVPREPRRSEWLSPGLAAREIGVDRHTVRNWIHRGLLPALRLPSGHFRVRWSTVHLVRRGGQPNVYELQLDLFPPEVASA